EVVGQIDLPADVTLLRVVVAVAVAVQPDAETGGGFDGAEVVDDVPELDLGRVDQVVHGAGHVQAEGDVDHGGGFGPRLGAAGAGRGQRHQGHKNHREAQHKLLLPERHRPPEVKTEVVRPWKQDERGLRSDWSVPGSGRQGPGLAVGKRCQEGADQVVSAAVD